MLLKAVILAAIIAVTLGIPLNQPFSGHFTYYATSGTGACGHKLNANTEHLVAVSHEWFTSANPNKDPVCKYCVKVNYKGKSIKVPVKDKCAGCAKDHMDLSLPAFKELASPSVGNAYGATFTFVSC